MASSALPAVAQFMLPMRGTVSSPILWRRRLSTDRPRNLSGSHSWLVTELRMKVSAAY